MAVAWPVTVGSVGEVHSTVAVGGHWIVGGVVLPTVIFCTQLTALPQLSLAVHVRVMTFVFGQSPGASVSA